MKILITGSRGQLGCDVSALLGKNHDVVAVGSQALDISDNDAVQSTVSAEQPDVLIN